MNNRKKNEIQKNDPLGQTHSLTDRLKYVLFRKVRTDGRTDGRTTCTKRMITTPPDVTLGRPRGSKMTFDKNERDENIIQYLVFSTCVIATVTYSVYIFRM